MNSANFPFEILQYFGIWRPKSWTSQFSIHLYNTYSFFIVLLMFTSFVSLCIYTIQIRSDFITVTENVFQILAFISLIIKILYVLMYRDDIIVFDNMFADSCCCPRDICELSIIEKFENTSRWNMKVYLMLGFSATVSVGLRGSNVSLPMKMWIPYSTNSKFIFWFTYLYQVEVVFSLVVSLITLNCCFIGLMQQISSQLEIINHRLCTITDMIDENDNNTDKFQSEFKIKACIAHHSHIFLAGQRLNNILSSITVLQFFLTSLSLCTVIYQLMITDIYSARFLVSLSGCSSFLFEIFLLCWYGQVMTDKSIAIADAALYVNWIDLTPAFKQYLIIMSMRAGKPIQLSGASIFTMSVETFLKILKVSYSAFNLIQSFN